MMKSFLLLILSLTTGCEASSVKGCEGGWVEFTCEYPNTNEKYQNINVVHPKRGIIQSRKEDTWENDGRVSLYHDTENKTLRVFIKSLQQEDFGEYQFKFEQESNSPEDYHEREEEENNQEVKKKLEQHKKNSDDCQTFHQTAYRAAKTTITCGNKPVEFLCKEKESTCEQISSTKSPPESNRMFTLDETSSDLSMSISDVSSQHDGVYWCGETSSDGTYRAGLRRIQLEVNDTITNFTKSPTSGQDFSAWCKYPNGAPIMKFLCKGEDPSTCEPIVSTTKKNSGRFSMVVDHSKTNITLTVRRVTTEDTGTYWCGAESLDERRSNVFITKFFLTVVPPTTTTPLPKESNGGSQFIIIIAVIVTGTVLVLVFVVVLAYNACGRSKNVEAVKEDRAYEEIREHPRNPKSGTALKTIYATADFPKKPSESQNYSSVNSQNSSGEVSGHIYSTVRDTEQGPTYSTVNHPTRIPNGPFYSTINSPQRH